MSPFAIGASMISAILPPMVNKAMDIIKDKAMDFMVDKGTAMVADKVDGAIVNIEREISNLQSTLHIIEGIVHEAEEKQIDNVYIQNWLRDVVDIGYEARDVLDDFFTFSSCMIEEATKVNFISSRISFMPSYFNIGGPSSGTSKLPVTILNQLAEDIKGVRERFDEKKEEGKTFATLKSVVGGGSESIRAYCRPEVGPLINKQRENLFLGREDVKEEIMEKLLHPSDNRVHVVPISGMGGIGKTTLAQSIYNDERLKEEDYPSKNRLWHCVGEKKFRAKKVIKDIINDSNITKVIATLQIELLEKLRGDRFLIVLDDVWDVDNNEWKLLFNLLTSVGKGGFIIITTRTSEVITAINTQTPDILKPLSKEDSWSIFESRAYINGKSDSTPDLKDIGQKIVEKLKGLPLALEVVGFSLLNEDSRTWKNFLNSNYHDVMSALRWSYSHLPPHVKMCFTYCSLFPKDHIFDEKELVEMWMGHDLIKKEEQKIREDVGAQYFKQLVNASLLQCVDGKYVMHDMIHDLALSVSNGEFATTNSKIDQMENVRHIIITPDDYSKIPRLCKIVKLLTLYTTCSDKEDKNWCDDSFLYDVFKQMKSIRVLVLFSKGIKEIPDCISELRHLRYLDVSKTSVKSLPDSLCHLYNLQMLAAPLNAELPRGIVNIPSLRHVRANLSTCEGVRKLTSLQELSSILICEGDNIRELGHMQQVCGKLTIKGLENVTSSEDAAGALMEKQTLMDQLELVFKQHVSESNISEEVLNAIRCPPNLTYLKIVGYNGFGPPSWIVDGNLVAKLQTLELSDCPQLKSLPPLGELTSLKHLSLQSLHGVKRLGDEFYGNLSKNKVFFPSLESLYFYDMQGWMGWDGIIIKNSSVSFFPCLTSLEIKDCPNIVLVLPTVKTSKRKREDKHPIMNAVNFLTSLSSLNISWCHGLKRLQLDALASLKILDISYCGRLIEIKSEVETTTERLHIAFCERLEKIYFERLPSLKRLYIASCNKLISNPCLAGIEILRLDHCKSLKALSINIRGLDSLEFLIILSCPVLELIFEERSSYSSSSGNSVAVQLRISTDNKQIFRKLLQHELISMESLHIEKLSGFENFAETEANNFCKLMSLKSLHISECEDLKSLPADFYKLSSLNSLKIVNCPKLQSLPPNFNKLSSLNSLHIDYCLQLQSLPPDFHKLSSLEKLHILHYPSLQSLPLNFHKLSSLEKLHILHCQSLQSLPPDFHKLSSLNSLEIVNCPQFQSLPPDFHKISSLNRLKIIQCPQFQSLPPDFYKLSSLNNLHIDYCLQLQSLPPDFHKLSSLKKLFLQHCPKLQSLPPDIHKLSSLKILVLKSCPELQSLPPNIHKLSSLKSLKIVNCPQHSLPQDFEKLSPLNSLHIEYCLKLQSLPPDFHKLSSLNSLNIVNCQQLQSLPPDFHKLSSLNSLEIVNCQQFQSLPPDFHKLSSLNRLQIVRCPQLQSLPPDFYKLSSLNHLAIDDCARLQSLPPNFHKLSSLENLYIIDFPRLQSPDFHKLSSLNSLKIVKCLQLQSLPPDFQNLSSLNSLEIVNCQQFQSLPHFHKLSSLKILVLKSCPTLQSLPPDIHKLSSLKRLVIVDCPQLESLPPCFYKLLSLNSLEIANCSQLQSLTRSINSLVIS